MTAPALARPGADRRLAVGVGAASVYLPIALTLPLGLLVGGTTGPGAPLSTGALLLHNALGGLLMVLAGLATLGALALVVSAVGWSINGYALGVVLADRGGGTLLSGMAHFAPETAGCTLLAAAGCLYGVRAGLRTLGRAPSGRREGLRGFAGLVGLGLALLVVAAVVEAHVLPAGTPS